MLALDSKPVYWTTIVLLAAFVTLLNALKPLYMDDPTYYLYAVHIAERPGDPYGFEVAEGTPANHVLAPPVLLYWWAAGIRLFGHHPVAWKVWLGPIVLLFAFALVRLFQRFARDVAMPLVVMTVLSPIYLPAWNLMLDVPALALGLFGLTVFFDACDRDSGMYAVFAGLIVGLAMQTKYMAFVVPAAMVLYAVLFRKLRLAALAVAQAIVLFVAWEAFIAACYGESHFLHSLHQRDSGFFNRVVHLILPLFGIVGGLTPALGILGLIALHVSRKFLIVATVIVLLGYVAIACVPESAARFVVDSNDKCRLHLNSVIFGTFGLAGVAIAGAVAGRLLRRDSHALWPGLPTGPQRSIDSDDYRVSWFLAGWLMLEVAGFFALSPFTASRRLMGVVLVTTILIGRLAGGVYRMPERARCVQAAIAASVLLGLGYYAIDLREAFASRSAVNDAVCWIRARDSEGVVWYRGPWGFQFFAEQTGVKPLSRKMPPRSGDWLISPDGRVAEGTSPSGFEPIAQIRVEDSLPLRTMPCYYDGRTALEHHEGPRFVVTIEQLHPTAAEQRLTAR